MAESIVKIEGLSHRYSVQWAVRDINLELNKRGIFGLLGANGAGKSTIMNVVCGVIKPTRGSIFIKGIDIQKDPVAAKKFMGFLPQQPPLQGEFNVEEFLTYAAGIRLVPDKDIPAAVTEVMEKCSLSHMRQRLIKNLSGGYKQRVGIAQSIIHKPEFVVLDEPTNGLDPNQILEVRQLIKEISEYCTVILSTHILQEVQALCDHIWMINDGSVVFSGGIEEFDNYIAPNSLLITFLAKPTKEELLAVPGITGVEELDGTKVRVRFAAWPESAEKLIEASMAKRWRLVEINLEKSSMEDIFIELSGKQSKS
ncbi:ABC transporter ATP-binding protein [Pseudoflavitalea sp. G-6-1-2]|uniref:ABC transporter ATP-binding protein n=1 Tax=Pseudoflavitalea sp. G-6-1-2 TaxID=2728841 RepID=UPI00146E2FBA|nr:ABC transporter ATP-binding protein [Pseudoflavitalea sp. G-6-1-2]NML22271.1 ABC transporter ATP-binding protein [Pseudoflavitalea sp. G-6-1-2]